MPMWHTTAPGSSLKISCGQKCVAFVRLVNHLDTLRTQPHWATQVMNRHEEGPEARLVSQVPRRPRQHDSDASPEYCRVDLEILGDTWTNYKHVALQHDELDEQCDQSTGWVPTNGCSTSQSRLTEARTIGTNGSNECTKNAIPGQRSSSIPTRSISSSRCPIGTCQVRTR